MWCLSANPPIPLPINFRIPIVNAAFAATYANIKYEIGEKIRRLRKQRKLTQEQLAEMIDISARNLSNIESGISFQKPETLEKLLLHWIFRHRLYFQMTQ